MLLQSGKGRDGKTDSDRRDYSYKERALLFEVWMRFVQMLYKHCFSWEHKLNATGSIHPKCDTLALLICRKVKEFRLIISEVTEHWKKLSCSEYPGITFLLFNYLFRLCLGQYLPGSIFTKWGCILTHTFSKGTALLTVKNSLLHLIGRNYYA